MKCVWDDSISIMIEKATKMKRNKNSAFYLIRHCCIGHEKFILNANDEKWEETMKEKPAAKSEQHSCTMFVKKYILNTTHEAKCSKHSWRQRRRKRWKRCKLVTHIKIIQKWQESYKF